MNNNPVGDNEPSYRFQWKTSHVLIGVFAIAVVLTIYQYIQINVIAPKTEITWQVFSLKDVNIARAQNRPIMIWIHDPEKDRGYDDIARVLEDKRIRKSVYQLNPLCAQCVVSLPVDPTNEPIDPVLEYVYGKIGLADKSCLYLHFLSNERKIENTFLANETTADEIANYLDVIEKQ